LKSFSIAILTSVFVAFFATAGAAGVDFGTASRNTKDVHLAGLVGVAFMMIFTCVAAIVIIAGAYGNPDVAQKIIATKGVAGVSATDVMNALLGDSFGKWLFVALALAAFPSACFSSLIAANSFKAMLPNINSTVSVTLGGAAAIALAISMQSNAGAIAEVLTIIGVSFGPICGAIFVEYFLCKGNWGGPRKGMNPAGWLAWAIGFGVGILPTFGICEIPMTPVVTFAIGAVVYFVAMKAGLKSEQK
jgi:cytosine permease